MSIRFAINGLGRIGRALLRIAEEREALELVAVNDLGSALQLSRLVAHDSLHGPFAGDVVAAEGMILLDGRAVTVHQQQSVEDIPWGDTGGTIVVDATGHCTSREAASGHLSGEVEKVIVSANAPDVDLTVCMGVNHRAYDPLVHHLLSAASCTTNCLVPVVSVLDSAFGLRRAMVNTVHSYNNDQRLLEFPHSDPRRARAAPLNMIPTTTSAIAALERVLPHLEDRLRGFAVRVPTPNVSLLDLVAELDRAPSDEALNAEFRRVADGTLNGVVGICEEPLVSSDFLRASESAIVDLPLTQALEREGAGLVRVVAWYDNEWGHASRLADLLELVGEGKNEETRDD